MTKSELFKAAHKLAKSVIQAGDNYSATFALCLKAVYAQSSSNVINIERSELVAWFAANSIKKGISKNGQEYAEVAADSEIYNKLLNGLTVIATRSKTGSTTTYVFGGEHGKFFRNEKFEEVTRFYGTCTVNKK